MIIDLDPAIRLKHRFRLALPYVAVLPVEEPATEVEIPATPGHALYMIYRSQRVQQGFEEFKWASLDIAQRLVWERTANILDLHL